MTAGSTPTTATIDVLLDSSSTSLGESPGKGAKTDTIWMLIFVYCRMTRRVLEMIPPMTRISMSRLATTGFPAKYAIIGPGFAVPPGCVADPVSESPMFRLLHPDAAAFDTATASSSLAPGRVPKATPAPASQTSTTQPSSERPGSNPRRVPLRTTRTLPCSRPDSGATASLRIRARASSPGARPHARRGLRPILTDMPSCWTWACRRMSNPPTMSRTGGARAFAPDAPGNGGGAE